MVISTKSIHYPIPWLTLLLMIHYLPSFPGWNLLEHSTHTLYGESNASPEFWGLLSKNTEWKTNWNDSSNGIGWKWCQAEVIPLPGEYFRIYLRIFPYLIIIWWEDSVTHLEIGPGHVKQFLHSLQMFLAIVHAQAIGWRLSEQWYPRCLKVFLLVLLQFLSNINETWYISSTSRTTCNQTKGVKRGYEFIEQNQFYKSMW
jgi:hypothetical protein